MKSRRFVKKRRRREARRVADRMSALAVNAWDRGEIDRFRAYLQRSMSPATAAAYERGE